MLIIIMKKNKIVNRIQNTNNATLIIKKKIKSKISHQKIVFIKVENISNQKIKINMIKISIIIKRILRK